MPIAFRHKYNQVTCIIDCLEIEIQKPSKAIHQALSWSEYKKQIPSNILFHVRLMDSLILYLKVMQEELVMSTY